MGKFREKASNFLFFQQSFEKYLNNTSTFLKDNITLKLEKKLILLETVLLRCTIPSYFTFINRRDRWHMIFLLFYRVHGSKGLRFLISVKDRRVPTLLTLFHCIPSSLQEASRVLTFHFLIEFHIFPYISFSLLACRVSSFVTELLGSIRYVSISIIF